MNVYIVFMSVLVGLFYLGLGCINIWDKDTAWRWQERQNQRSGREASRRDHAWEQRADQRGRFFLGLGLLFSLGSLFVFALLT